MFFVFLYLPYMVGEICYMSGIVTTLTAGLAARKFVHPNLTGESQVHIQSFMKMLAGLAETAAFLDLGMTCTWSWRLERNDHMQPDPSAATPSSPSPALLGKCAE